MGFIIYYTQKTKKGWSFLKQIIKKLRFKRIDASESEPFYILFYICAAEETKTVYDKPVSYTHLDVYKRQAPTYTVMLNPEISKKDGAYDTEENCLSLLGGPRPCKRYKSIKVKYQTLDMQTRIKTYTGWTAQILSLIHILNNPTKLCL